jgi:hypothetical protein
MKWVGWAFLILLLATAAFVVQDRIRNGPAAPHRVHCTPYRTSWACR